MGTDRGPGARERARVVFWAAAILLVSVLSSRASPPPPTGRSELTFQCRLTAPDGQPLDGTFALIFKLYASQTGGAPVWTEARDGVTLPKVVIHHGILSVDLGEGTPLDPSTFASVAGGDLFVGIDLAGTEVARVKLTAAAFAVVANVANGLWDPSAGVALDLPALDGRYAQADAVGHADTATHADEADHAAGASVADSAAVSTAIANPAGGAVTLSDLDGRYAAAGSGVQGVNGQTGNVSIVAGSNVTVTTGTGTVTIAAAAGGIDQATADARYVNASGDSVSQLNVGQDLHVGNWTYADGGVVALGVESSTGASYVRTSSTTLRIDHPSGDGKFTASFPGGTIHCDVLEATIKSFVVPDPLDVTKEVVYDSLEGPGADMFVRGSAALVDGQATIVLPDHFAALAAPGTTTAQVTPTAECNGLFVASRDEHQVVVKELAGGHGAATFDYVVFAHRAGTDHPVVRDRQR
jgi:hypothetical protein